jgi:hypothetical protein
MTIQKYSTRFDLKEGESEDENLVQLLPDRAQWWARVNTVFNVLVP